MHFFSSDVKATIHQEIIHPCLEEAGVLLTIKREDLIHHQVSGNKFRKLKYNLIEAKESGYDSILTFGGAFSNHIAATAAAGELTGLRTIGVIRGDELANDLNSTLAENDTLRFASEAGMKLKFVDRTQYRNKMSPTFINELKAVYGDFYMIPEGGTNALAVQGCQEILTPEDKQYDIVCSAVGTGGTISGIINSSFNKQRIIGFPALKGTFLTAEIKKYTSKTNWELNTEYHFGGYGKINIPLIEFINQFKTKHQIPLDPIYTGKMIFGIFDQVRKGNFKKNTRILAIHTGGLQGISGMNRKLKKKDLPQIL